MKIVMKGNRQLTVADETAQRYLEDGYCEVNDKGQVIQKGKEKSLEVLRRELRRLEKVEEERDALKKALDESEKEKSTMKAVLQKAGLTW